VGVLTDFFLANDAEMAKACRGWKRPLPLLGAPVRRVVTNPFTKKPVEFFTRLPPGRVAADPHAVDHPSLDGLPRIDQKGLMDQELRLLGEVVMGWDEPFSADEISGRQLIGPDSTEIAVFEIPPELLRRLESLSPAECESFGMEWGRRMQEINEFGVGSPADWAARLCELSAFAKRAAAENRKMYVWICP
jgi:hypothetical protein